MDEAPDETRGALARLIADLRRRRVVEVAAGYVVAAWVAVQVVDTVGIDLGLPPGSTRFVFYAAAIALPLVVALAWVYDIGPATQDASGSRRRVGIVLLAALPLVAAAGLFVLRTLSGPGVAQAHSFVEQAAELLGAQRYGEAYDLLEQAREVIPDDSALTELWPEVVRPMTVTTDPPGASVRALRFSGFESGDSTWATLGTTPIRDLTVPRDDHLLELTLDGYRPAERLFAPSFDLTWRDEVNQHPDSGVAVRLQPTSADEPPENMVQIPGGKYELVSPDMPRGLVATLDQFYVDRFEVTNRDYREFIVADGYADETFWTEFPDLQDPAETVALFVDRSGLPGPRDWIGQSYLEGTGNHPVTGITWYEAAAYAAFRGRSLLTLHQWEKAARDGALTGTQGIVLPWGFAGGVRSTSNRVRSLAGDPGPVDEHPFGQSPYGAYAMAGNVKEWLANQHGEGRAVAGGSWQDPLYLFSAVGGHDPLYASSTLGFRTAWLDPDRRRLSQDQGMVPLDTLGITPVYRPVDRATFRTFRTHFRYDRRAANAEVVASKEESGWVRERIEFDGPEGERVVSYLYLPHRSPPPHQPVLFVPGASTFFGVEVPTVAEALAAPLVQSGRAVFAVVMKGMTGREFDADFVPPDLQSVAFRDLMVLHATEMRMGLDYLETRDDIEMSSAAYMGVSFGAGSRLIFAAVDDRFQGIVFVGGGIDERVKPVVAEADNVNFAPYLDVPTLLVNGRQDEEHPWLTRGLPLWNLLSEPKELVLVEGAGHHPPTDVLIPAVEAFLDTIRSRTRPPDSD